MNQIRTSRAFNAVQAYSQDEDLAANIVDLVTDLLHLAAKNDIEPDYVIHTAIMHYDAEIHGE